MKRFASPFKQLSTIGEIYNIHHKPKISPKEGAVPNIDR